jgi:hypothetical protein
VAVSPPPNCGLNVREAQSAPAEGVASGLSSVPTSPIATTRSSLSKPVASDSDESKSPSPRPRTRSISPHSRNHRRSISSHMLPKSSIGLSHKKKRVPAPLQSTEYHFDESSRATFLGIGPLQVLLWLQTLRGRYLLQQEKLGMQLCSENPCLEQVQTPPEEGLPVHQSQHPHLRLPEN